MQVNKKIYMMKNKKNQKKKIEKEYEEKKVN